MGLFSFLSDASVVVKPILLDIYQDHYLSLGVELKPCLKAFILALLPGLEEENAIQSRVLIILEELNKTIGQEFYKSLWMGIISSKKARLNGFYYLLKKFSNVNCTKEDLGFLIGTEPLLMVKALSKGLKDDLMVQRNALDFLLKFLPFPELENVFKDHAKILVFSGLRVALRRDMSLNRRLYTWILSIFDKD
jgi:hypothetical protein